MTLSKNKWFKSSSLKLNAGLMIAVLGVSTLGFNPTASAVPSVINGSSWSQCVSPGTQQPWSGCFNSGTSTYAWVNSNVRYNLPYDSTNLSQGAINLKINYRQKSTALPANYGGYNIEVLASYDAVQLKSVAKLTLPAAGPDVAKSYDAYVTIPKKSPNPPFADPRFIELQWSNDAADAAGDANLQIDSVAVDLSPYEESVTMTGNAYSQCVNPNYQDQWSGCFDTISSNPAVASTVAYETANITYETPQMVQLYDPVGIRIKYRQHNNSPAPSGYASYNVSVLGGVDGTTGFAPLGNATYNLPVGSPDAVMTYDMPNIGNLGRSFPLTKLQLKWLNDAANASGDANLQIDSISFITVPNALYLSVTQTAVPACNPTCPPGGTIHTDFSWFPAPAGKQVTAYEIYRNGSFYTSVSGQTSTYSLVQPNSGPSENYVYTVRAVNFVGAGQWSNAVTVRHAPN